MLPPPTDPNMLGGPFLDLPESAVPEIKTLIQETTTQFQKLIAFARDFKAFDQILQDGADGFAFPDSMIECRHPWLAQLKFHTI